MEVEEAPCSISEMTNINPVIATSSTPSSVSILLHPLVVMNISEHWTRVGAQQNQSQQVVGALIGKQTGRKVEVMNSFELVYTFDSETKDITIDREYYYKKDEQFKQVFKDLDFLGWYTTGGPPDESDINIQRQMCMITESPIILKLNTAPPTSDLPISVYESVIGAGQEAQMRLVQLPYTLATEEAERIGVDHVARVSNVESGSADSSAADHLESQYNCILMLYTRVRFLLKYIEAVGEGKLPHNHEIIREIHALCCRLPVLEPSLLSKDLFNQYNDVTLMTYLGMISKGCHTMNQCISKFNILNDRQGAGRRIRGLFS